MPGHYLKGLFDPTSIAIIGASETEDTLAALITSKLHNQFTGKLYFVNPKHKELLETECFKKVTAIEEPIDLAIIVSPLRTVEKVIRECGKQGIGNAFVMTKYPNTYKSEITSAMKSLLNVAKEANVRILGPNAAALIRPSTNFNASITDNKILPGKLAVVARSRTICSSIIDWAETEQVGFSSIISRGSGIDLEFSDILDFLANDHKTSSIIIHINQVTHSRAFMGALKAAAMRKPVVILKSSHDNGSYSDAIAKTKDVRAMDDVFHAAVLRAGADHVTTLSHLYTAAKILANNRRTKGNNLALISNGYGPIMLANDRLRDLGFKATILSKELIGELKSTSKNIYSCENAIVISDRKNTAELYAENIKILLASKEVDGIGIIFAPDAMIDSKKLATEISNVVKNAKKPSPAIWLGTASGGQGRRIFTENNVSNYRSPEAAMDGFSFLCNHLANRKRLLQVPFPLNKSIPPNIDVAKEIIDRNLQQRRNVLSRKDSILLVEAFHIKCNPSLHAETVEEALKIAKNIGYPVALKIDSQHITYKSDVEGVKLNIQDSKMLKKAFLQIKTSLSKLRSNIIIDGIIVERMHAPSSGRLLNISILNDPAFGPVISFGPGGTQSPAIRDRAIQLPPLNRRLAEDLINNTQVSLILDKYRNLPAANKDKLREVLIRVSEMAIHLPQIFELVLNPLILDENEAIVNDLQIVVQKSNSDAKHFSHLAIHPYPSDWRRCITIKGNKKVELRPIRSEDAQAEIELIDSMSSKSKYFRFMHAVNDLTPEMLSRFTKLDYDREMAFGAFIQKKNKDKLLGVSRYAINPDKQSCEFAIGIADKYQGLGLARQLMLILIEHVKDRDLKIIEGTVLKNNTSMDNLMASLGFKKSASKDDYDINIYTFEFDS
ncbi:bifunctional acetate--CoA ligase family protein/GNAT family N-acetyltransferase [uncultured Cocleimonas sp.]|uniref:bifunctional acetate--CoA ligase family protein/GNAT family N-acetyltransferase n=1 Tax=uncultured Cocleimonas sp. TaxID=1051587 RepID=UPI002639B662|nr:GNAT family N-acetyltransferase [uncultured Cocleimonas sp.]